MIRGAPDGCLAEMCVVKRVVVDFILSFACDSPVTTSALPTTTSVKQNLGFLDRTADRGQDRNRGQDRGQDKRQDRGQDRGHDRTEDR